MRQDLHAPSSREEANETEQNRAIVARAFEAWAAGANNFFDILDEAAEWTIVGSGPSAQTFRGRKAFMDGGYGPILARFASGMRPTVNGLYADGSHVIIEWDGEAPMKDGQTYRNTYAWIFQMRGGKVIKATAFLDLPTYDAALDGRPLPT